MDEHSFSSNRASLLEGMASELRNTPHPVDRQHLLYGLLEQAEMSAMIVSLPDDMSEIEKGALHSVVRAALDGLSQGVSSLSVIGQRDTGHRFEGLEASAESETFRDDIAICPTGLTYRAGTVGPFDLNLPTWVPPHMAAELAGLMWRVLRFCLAGHVDGVASQASDTAREMLKKHDLEKLAPQYVAIGFMRWLLTIGGVRTFDVFGKEVDDTPEYFYGELFADPECMPKAYAEQANRVGRELDGEVAP